LWISPYSWLERDSSFGSLHHLAEGREESRIKFSSDIFQTGGILMMQVMRYGYFAKQQSLSFDRNDLFMLVKFTYLLYIRVGKVTMGLKSIRDYIDSANYPNVRNYYSYIDDCHS
jgi:hypothetical protein